MLKLFLSLLLLTISTHAINKTKWTITKSDCLGEFCCSPKIGSELTIISDPSTSSTKFIPTQFENESCQFTWSSKSISIPKDLSQLHLENSFDIFETQEGSLITIQTENTLESNTITLQVNFPNFESYEITATQAPLWQGVFYALVQCNPSVCCCPDSRLISFTPDPNNSSQVFLSASFPNNSVCSKLGWNSQSQIALPWPSNFQSNNSSPYSFKGSNGLVFTLATVSYPNGTFYVDMRFDQTSVGGSSMCFYQINNAPPAWIGEWLVLESCNPQSCCCPSLGANILFSINPANTSQVLINASWENSPICQKLGWTSQASVALPFSQLDLFLDQQNYQYSAANGLSYNINSLQQYNYTYVASINVNQQNAGGSSTCKFKVNNNPPAWNGGWVSMLQCGILNCCCPYIGSNMILTPDSQNSSQMILSGVKVFGLVCDEMNWKNDTSYTFPWGNYDLFFNGSNVYTDARGIKYNLTMNYQINGTIGGWLQMDQTSVGGPNYCGIPINNNLQ